MPQQQYVMGGDFATASSTVAAAKLVEVRRELREVGEEIALVTPVSRNVPLAAQQLIRESGAAVLLGGSSADATSPAVLPLLRTMGFSPFMPGAGAPAPMSEVVHSSPSTSVVSLSALAAGLPLQRVGVQSPANQAGGTGESELARLMASRVLGMAEIGVPPPCIAVLSEAGVHAGNMADLPWEVVHSTVSSVSGVGVAHLTLLQALHARLQAAREARSSKSGSRSNSRASSKAGSRSGVSGQGAGSVRLHVSQSVAFGSQQQQAAAGLAAAGLGLQFATADASAGAAFAGAAAEVLDPFAVTVKQPGASPWMIRFPSQPTGAGTAAEPVWLGGECAVWAPRMWKTTLDEARRLDEGGLLFGPCAADGNGYA